MSTRNRTSGSSATARINNISLALNESYDEEIAPLLTTIDQSKILFQIDQYFELTVLSSKSSC